MRKLEVNGYPIAYVDEGRGEPLVMVHGSLSDYRYWARQAGPLRDSLRVISLSLRHYYPERWDGAGDDFTTRQHVDDVAAFIAALGLTKAHLLGHSRGGNVAFWTARRHPDQVRSLILAEPGSELDDALMPAAAGSLAGAEFRALAAEAIRHGDVDRGLAIFIDGVSGAGSWDAMHERSRQVTRDNAYTLIGQVEDRREPITPSDAAAIRVPVLLVGGERSPPPFPQIIDALERALPNCRRMTIPGASHMMNVEKPEPFNAAVRNFLAGA